MARKIKRLEDAPVDIIEAVKRAFIRRGFIPRKYRRNSQLEDAQITTPPIEKSKRQPQTPAQAEEASEKREPDDQEVSRSSDEEEPGETHEKLIDITEKAHDVLFQADSVFPFTLFPDSLIIDREKITIVSRSFIQSAKTVTAPITSLISAEAEVGPFFGSLHITSKYFQDSTQSVEHLWRKDAEEAHRLLQGYIIANERGIDVMEIEKEDLKVLLNDLGQSAKE
ncbi:MAG TPA: hypothetical protein VHD84_00350 [Candidatus Saccharimonadales bacterium]|nr:hypothetical protein [Candidatus Saccharimonadales bacterium]